MSVIELAAKRDRSLSRIFTWLLTLNFLGYPWIGAIASLQGAGDNTLAVGLRAVTLGFSGLAIGYMIALIEPNRWRWFGWPFMVFCIMCVVRLNHDGETIPEAYDLLGRYIGILFVPALCLSTVAPEYDELRASYWMAVVGSVFSIMMVGGWLLGQAAIVETTESLGGRLALERLNPISMGQAAAATLIAILSLFRYRNRLSAIMILFLTLGFVASLTTVALSGSRGPFIGLAVVMITVLILRRQFFLTGVVTALLTATSFYITSDDLNILERLSTVGNDSSSLERLQLQKDAIDQFILHPITGNMFVEQFTGYYPHNLVVHAAMSLGVLGLSLMVYLLLAAGYIAMRRLWSGDVLLPLLFISYTVVAMFSGSIFEGDYLALIGIMLVRSRPSLADMQRRQIPAVMQSNAVN